MNALCKLSLNVVISDKVMKITFLSGKKWSKCGMITHKSYKVEKLRTAQRSIFLSIDNDQDEAVIRNSLQSDQKTFFRTAFLSHSK